MRIIKGNKKIELTENEFTEIRAKYQKMALDIGTGNGRYVFKKALKNKDVLYIGLDPSAKSLEEYSKKAVKEKISNLIFVVGSIELLPYELINSANEITIILPWGTLLQAVVNPTDESVKKLKNLIRSNGTLKIIFGYDDSLEPGETKRLNLNPISEEFIQKNIIPVFQRNDFKLNTFTTLATNELKEIESSWGKRIAQRPERPIFMLVFLYGKNNYTFAIN